MVKNSVEAGATEYVADFEILHDWQRERSDEQCGESCIRKARGSRAMSINPYDADVCAGSSVSESREGAQFERAGDWRFAGHCWGPPSERCSGGTEAGARNVPGSLTGAGFQ